jgi:hypothetical protein
MSQMDGLLNVSETAKALRRSTEQVRRYLREGTLVGRRIGGQWFIDRADAAAFQARQRAGSDFMSRLAAADPDPLGQAIAVGASGGADVAKGRMRYLRVVSGTRSS